MSWIQNLKDASDENERRKARSVIPLLQFVEFQDFTQGDGMAKAVEAVRVLGVFMVARNWHLEPEAGGPDRSDCGEAPHDIYRDWYGFDEAGAAGTIPQAICVQDDTRSPRTITLQGIFTRIMAVLAA